MLRFKWDLPFQIPLNPRTYSSSARGIDIEIVHRIIEQEHLDQRLGGISGTFGFERDNLGLLRYSQLEYDLDDLTERQAREAFQNELISSTEQGTHALTQHLALLLCNDFLDKLRMVIGSTDVRPLKVGDLAHLTYQTENTSGQARLYGGGITLPIAGHATTAEQVLAQELGSSRVPLAFELDILDAVRAGRDGLAREAEVLAIGALETGLDFYYSRLWRQTRPPSERVAHAVSALDPRRKKTSQLFTIDDVLQEFGVRKKLDLYLKSHQVQDMVRVRVERAIESRNIVVHSGGSIDPSIAERHATSIRVFLLHFLLPQLEQVGSGDAKPELIHAYEEATGTPIAPALEQILNDNVTRRGLTATLYNERRLQDGPSSDHLSNTVVIRIPFSDPVFSPQRTTLYLARMLIHFAERRKGVYAEATVPDSMPFPDTFTAWNHVAHEINRTVWDTAVDRAIRQYGLVEELDADIQSRVDELKDSYLRSYSPAIPGELRDYVEFMRLSRVLSAMDPQERPTLAKVVKATAPKVLERATSVIEHLDNATFDRPESILKALIRVHDAERRILATVPIFDPSTQRFHGRGVNPDS